MYEESDIHIRPTRRLESWLRVTLLAGPLFGLLFSAGLAMAADEPFLAVFWPLGAGGGALFGAMLGVCAIEGQPLIAVTLPRRALREALPALTHALTGEGLTLAESTDDRAEFRRRSRRFFLAPRFRAEADRSGDLVLSGERTHVAAAVLALCDHDR